ncbi:uncharacterized protein LOC126843005 [Adelges cooleyi]|uniref:uncharacterized protein LOC126843005 n=1 Tax=Adelges cooleyi TaxID=133065 RepID=UPI00217FF595|nr:uncharacterized protein LOC126843005 [Adelges cooleyi]
MKCSTCQDKLKNVDLVVQWYQTKSMVNGYGKQDFEFSPDRSASRGQLRQAIVSKFNALKCGYLFGAHSHFSLIRNVFLDEYSDRMKNISDRSAISFSTETENIFRSLFNAKGVQMNEIWSVVRFATKIEYYLRHWEDRHFMRENNKKMLQARDFFVWQLETYLEANCTVGNFFNMKSNTCLHYKSVEDQLKDNYSHELALFAASVNKGILNQLSNHNFVNGLRYLDNHDITFTDLEDVMYYIFKEDSPELERCGRVILGRDDWYKWATTTNSQIKRIDDNGLASEVAFGKYNLMMLDVHKMCMLRITWLSMTRIDSIGKTRTEENPINGNNYVRQINPIIAKFISLLNLSHDDFFYQLNDFFSSDPTSYIRNKDAVMEEIAHQHNLISIALGISPINDRVPDGGIGIRSSEAISLLNSTNHGSIKLDHGKTGIPDDKLKELIAIANELNKEINYHRSSNPVKYKLFHSFMKFIEDKSGRIEQFLLEKKPEKQLIKLSFD